MRIFLRFLASIFLLILLFLSALFFDASRNWIIKNIAEKALSSKSTQIKIESISSSLRKTHIGKINIIKNNEIFAAIDKTLINYDLKKIFREKILDVDILVEDNATIFGVDNFIKAHINLYTKNWDDKKVTFKIDEISSPLFQTIGMGDINGTCSIHGKKSLVKLEKCKFSDDKSDFQAEFAGHYENDKISDLTLNGALKKIPVDLHQSLYKIFPEDPTISYLNETMTNLKISNLSWNIELPKEFFQSFKMKNEYVKANFDIDHIDYLYVEDYPPLKNLKSNTHIIGSDIVFKNVSGDSGSSKVFVAEVGINWECEGLPNVIVKNGKYEGPVSDLIDFIPKDSLAGLKKNNIDLKTIKGEAKGNLNLDIPLCEDEKIKFDITSDIENVGLNIFKDQVKLKSGKLSGKFDGDNIIISGTGMINRFKSSIEYKGDLSGKGEFDNILNIQSKLRKLNYKKTLPIFSIDSGMAYLNIEYKDKNDKQFVSAKSDLYSLEFGIDKLGIHKKKNDTAMLEIEGQTSDKGTLPLRIKLQGKKLDIDALANLSDTKSSIDFRRIKNHDTNIRGSIEYSDKFMKSMVFGDFIDLSRSNMIQFLAKDAGGFASDIKVKFKEVRLKDGVYLDNFNLDIECEESRCNKGLMKANIGDGQLSMNLEPLDNYEQWTIKTDDAGAAFRGFGILGNIRSGDLAMTVKTNIKTAEIGRIIPIAEGDFEMKSFTTTKNKILTRLVSFVSLPGLLSAITNNKDISFNVLKGKFSYKDDIISISDGSANGPFLDLTLKGQINTAAKQGKIKGRVIPSLYGANKIVQNIPVIGNLFGGRKNKGIVQAPYTIEYEY